MRFFVPLLVLFAGIACLVRTPASCARARAFEADAVPREAVVTEIVESTSGRSSRLFVLTLRLTTEGAADGASEQGPEVVIRRMSNSLAVGDVATVWFDGEQAYFDRDFSPIWEGPVALFCIGVLLTGLGTLATRNVARGSRRR
jgi:hypothetical protein